MTTSEAIQVLVDLAGRWGENAEEDFSRRISANDTDEDCAKIAADSQHETEDVLEVRDLWLAVEVASKEINKAVQPAPR
jgi:hypothetical protein